MLRARRNKRRWKHTETAVAGTSGAERLDLNPPYPSGLMEDLDAV